MTTLPASVRIIDLPAATTITGSEMLEVVQTGVGGTMLSVQIPLTAFMTATLGALPTGGGTSQILAKSSGSNYSTAWYDVTSFITVNTTSGLATSGTGTAVVVRVATGGIGSTELGAFAVQSGKVATNAIGDIQLRQGSPLSIIGVTGNATANVADIVASAANQVLQVNAGGTGLQFTTLSVVLGTGSVVRSNLTAFIIGSGQLDTSAILRANFTAFAIGSAQIDTSAILRANLTAFAIGSGQVDTSGIVRANLTAFAIGSGQIDTSAVLRANFTAFAVGSAQIDTSAILRANLTAFAIGSAQIDTAAVLRANLTAFAVGSGQIDTSGVVRANLTSFLIGSAQIDTAAVGSAQFRQSAGLSVVGNASTATANVTDIASGGGWNTLISNAANTTLAFSRAGQVLLNTLTPNGVASANDTTSFTSAFTNYLFLFENVCPDTNTTFLQMQVATSGSNFISGSYVSGVDTIVGAAAAIDLSTTAFLLTGNRATNSLQTTTVAGYCGYVRFTNPSSSIIRKSIVGEASFASSSGTFATTSLGYSFMWGFFDGNSNPITGVNFLFSSGNIQTGTIRIYGIP